MYSDVRDDEGQSPLDLALGCLDDEGCVDVALYLMSRGCGGDEDKANLLCRACQYGMLGVLKELVEQHKFNPKSECDNLLCSLFTMWCAKCDISNTTLAL